ncbi:hypothetical protein QI600_003201 [Salmonella enterica]|nr:hypothetical protein [Salmonella enterica]
MTTRKITVTRDWQQLTDGTQDTVIQFLHTVELCRSPGRPGEDAAALRFSRETLTLTKPDVVWIRSGCMDGYIPVTVW